MADADGHITGSISNTMGNNSSTPTSTLSPDTPVIPDESLQTAPVNQSCTSEGEYTLTYDISVDLDVSLTPSLKSGATISGSTSMSSSSSNGSVQLASVCGDVSQPSISVMNNIEEEVEKTASTPRKSCRLMAKGKGSTDRASSLPKFKE